MKQIIISKCEECPHSIFDEQEQPRHWGKWCCSAEATESSEFRLLDDISVGFGPVPSWCPLDDFT